MLNRKNILFLVFGFVFIMLVSIILINNSSDEIKNKGIFSRFKMKFTQDELLYEVIEPNDSMENSEEAEVTDEVSNEDVEAYTNQVVVNESLDPNKNGSDVYKFTATSSEPHYKIFISNTSNYPLHVSITKNSASGPEVATPYDIPAHSNSTKYYTASGLGDEDRYVNVSSPTSTALSGTISVKIATTQGELG